MRLLPLLVFVFGISVTACSAQEDEEDPPPQTKEEADVTAIEVSGDPGDYTFSVTVRSPDTGCEQYADWWEVTSPEGADLIHRRILAHPHANEQPFTRRGGPVAVARDSTVVVRAHMNNAGYGGRAMRGSVADGFSEADLPDGFGDEIEEASPDC